MTKLGRYTGLTLDLEMPQMYDLPLLIFHCVHGQARLGMVIDLYIPPRICPYWCIKK